MGWIQHTVAQRLLQPVSRRDPYPGTRSRNASCFRRVGLSIGLQEMLIGEHVIPKTAVKISGSVGTWGQLASWALLLQPARAKDRDGDATLRSTLHCSLAPTSLIWRDSIIISILNCFNLSLSQRERYTHRTGSCAPKHQHPRRRRNGDGQPLLWSAAQYRSQTIGNSGRSRRTPRKTPCCGR